MKQLLLNIIIINIILKLRVIVYGFFLIIYYIQSFFRLITYLIVFIVIFLKLLRAKQTLPMQLVYKSIIV